MKLCKTVFNLLAASLNNLRYSCFVNLNWLLKFQSNYHLGNIFQVLMRLININI